MYTLRSLLHSFLFILNLNSNDELIQLENRICLCIDLFWGRLIIKSSYLFRSSSSGPHSLADQHLGRVLFGARAQNSETLQGKVEASPPDAG